MLDRRSRASSRRNSALPAGGRGHAVLGAACSACPARRGARAGRPSSTSDRARPSGARGACCSRGAWRRGCRTGSRRRSAACTGRRASSPGRARRSRTRTCPFSRIRVDAVDSPERDRAHPEVAAERGRSAGCAHEQLGCAGRTDRDPTATTDADRGSASQTAGRAGRWRVATTRAPASACAINRPPEPPLIDAVTISRPLARSGTDRARRRARARPARATRSARSRSRPCGRCPPWVPGICLPTGSPAPPIGS